MISPGVYWYRGPFRVLWSKSNCTEQVDWMVVGVHESGYGDIIGREDGITPEELEQMNRDGRFVEIGRPQNG